MRKLKTVINMLRRLSSLLAEESARDPEFSSKLDALLPNQPKRKAVSKRATNPALPERLPDIHTEWNVRGETDFRLWLRDQPIQVLRAVIRAQDLDASHRTTKWKEPEKLAEFIADSLRARLLRGSAFIGRETTK